MSEVRELNDAEWQAFRVRRLVAVEMMPYFAAGLFSMIPVAAPGLGTFAVDKNWRLYMDPQMLLGEGGWSVQDGAGVLLHELGHLVREHAIRADALDQPVDRHRWNLACDAEINDDLLIAEVALPEGVVTPEALGFEPGLMAENYYRPQSSDAASASGGAGSGGSGSGDDDDDPGCGSGSGSAPIPGELPAGSSTGGRSGVDEATADVLRRQIAVAVREYGSRGRGTMPAGLARWADRVLAPPVTPWQRVLSAAVRSSLAEAAGRTEYSYRRPSRRQVPGVVLPAMRGPKLTVTIVVDTSGSMGTGELTAALSEISGIVKVAGVARERLTVMACDAQTAEPQRIQRVEDIELIGGGGTDMRIGIAAAEELRPAPQVVIVLTDGLTPWPDVPTRAKLVCVVIGNEQAAHATPRFATTVTVPSAT